MSNSKLDREIKDEINEVARRAKAAMKYWRDSGGEASFKARGKEIAKTKSAHRRTTMRDL